MSLRTLFSGIKDWYNEINGATLTGAIDVIVVEQEDGSYLSSPFHVRFGKLGVLKAKEKIVDIEVNGDAVDIHMKLDDNGAAFFVEGLEEGESLEDPILATSPLPTLTCQEPSWTESEREAINRSLNFDDNEADKSEEMTDEIQVVEPQQCAAPQQVVEILPKNKNNKNKRKRKTKKHSRSASKSSLKEVAAQAEETPEDTPEATPEVKKCSVPPQFPTPLSHDYVTSTPTAVVEPSLLLSRLPNPDLLDSCVVDEDDPRAASEAIKLEDLQSSKKSNIAGSLPIAIEKPQYFSEPEISPANSPNGSRPPTPTGILSDTEYETRSHRGSISSMSKKEAAAEQSWEWGQLPTSTSPQHSKEVKSESMNSKDVNKSGGSGFISYLFGGPSKKKDIDDDKGVYLDDLINKDDEELKLYLGSSNRSRNDTISGNENDDTESGTGTSLPMSPHSVEGAIGYPNDDWPHAEISLCGGLGNEFSPIMFEQSKMSFDDFVARVEERPDLLSDPGLVVKLNDTYLKWETAAPIVMSQVLYGRSLPNDLVEKLKGKKKNANAVSVTSENNRKSSWWPFSSRKEKEEQEGVSKMQSVSEETPVDVGEIATVEANATSTIPEVNIINETSPRKRRSDNSSSSEGELDMEKKEKYRKTLRLNSELIKHLNLKKGANEIRFSVTTAYQGTTRCFCHVYFWNYTDKIVISDIDGTITKSDVLGHVLPIIGRDWSQSGVTSLFTKIVNNGYHIVYLSARAIGQASITKDYLASIKQGEVNLPDGPIFLNPTSLVNAFHREVVEKKPEVFKIACLKDIKSLFPESKNPFYAGYGNRVNDVWAYQAVGIPMSRIFTINPKGELRHEITNTFKTSYGSMTDIVDHIFPPTDANSSPSMALDYSSFTYWRDPVPTITTDLDTRNDENQSSGMSQMKTIDNAKPEEEAPANTVVITDTASGQPEVTKPI